MRAPTRGFAAQLQCAGLILYSAVFDVVNSLAHGECGRLIAPTVSAHLPRTLRRRQAHPRTSSVVKKDADGEGRVFLQQGTRGARAGRTRPLCASVRSFDVQSVEAEW